jgi:hypothetical protein
MHQTRAVRTVKSANRRAKEGHTSKFSAQTYLAAIVQHKHLAVLKRTHGTGIAILQW